MSARVLVIGLDSAESTLIERWTREGKLPALAELVDRGTMYRLDNCWSTFPTAVWPELTSGRSVGTVALYHPPAQLRTGEVEPRRVSPEEVDSGGFWTIASDAGARVAAIDLPWTVPPSRLNGIFLAEWGTHDRWFGTSCLPPALADEIRAQWGDYPVRLCDDDYGSSDAERQRLATDLVEAVAYETRVLLGILEREPWDLFACAFGQFQCAGHNLWRHFDGTNGARVPESLRNAMFDVYSKVDEGIGALRAAAGDNAVSVVFSSHGMGPLRGGPQLLEEVLVRLGLGSGKGRASEVRSRLPLGMRRTIRTLVPAPLRRRLQHAAGSLPAPLASADTKAIALPSDVNGFVRLNIQGREPEGSVTPGARARDLLADLRGALDELVQPSSGEPIVAGTLSAEEAFGERHHSDVPDLIVRFRTDLGNLDSCVSERVGLVKVPVKIANRSGEHNGEARLWLAGHGVESSDVVGRAHALDVAPTILALLGVPAPAELDGRSIVDAET